jgi:hypothetical protein
VDKVKKGKGRVVNARFAAMSAHYLFDPDFCNVASGWEKVCVRQTHPRRRDTAATALPAASQSMYYSEAGCQL